MSVPSRLHPATSADWLESGFSVAEFETLRLKLAHKCGDRVLDIQGALSYKLLGFGAAAAATYFLAEVSPSEAVIWESSRKAAKGKQTLVGTGEQDRESWFPDLVASWVKSACGSNSAASQQLAHAHIGTLWLCAKKVSSFQQVETLLSRASHTLSPTILNRILTAAYGNRTAPVNTLGALTKTRDLQSFPLEELEHSSEQALSAAIQLAEDLDTDDQVPEVRDALNIGLLLS